MKQWTRMLLLGALSLGTAQTLGCAAERDPINRVQLNALPKSFFLGQDLQNPDDDPEFYSRGTVTDVGYGASQDGLFTSTYAQPVSRIKWEVTEKFLIGRLAYERIADSDGKGYGKNLTNKQDGQIVALYPIESHFDIRRDYNPATGEETNVLVENSSDRPWNQREHFRVDFSQNENMDSYDFDTLSMMGVYGGVKYEPIKYYVSDPNSIDAPHFDPKGGYLDITNKAFAAPQLIDLSSLGWGNDSFPACMLPNVFSGGTEPVGNCNPVEITVRQSFVRIEKNDYEAKDWDGNRFQAYGAFTEDRKGYSRNYGLIDDKWHRFIARYDVWDRHHYYDAPATMSGPVACGTSETPLGADPARDLNGDGTADECEAVTDKTGHQGSQCDVFVGKCTLPYVDRKAHGIAWYMNINSGPTYWEGTEWAAHEWDVAMRSAELVAKNAECRRFGSADDCDADFPVYNGQQDEHDDAISLAKEVDDCRHQIAHTDLKGDEGKCTALAEDIGTARGHSKGVIALAKMPEAIALCHSPVEANDPEICGDAYLNDDGTEVKENGKVKRHRLPAGITAEECRQIFLKGTKTPDEQSKFATCANSTIVRLGDLRYHQVNNIIAPQEPSAWGIMTDASDPITGRKIAASINVWTHINDLWSQGLVDQIRYTKGELTTEDLLAGTQITQKNYSDQIKKMAANVQGWSEAADSSARFKNGLTSADVADRIAQSTGLAKGTDIKAPSPAALAKSAELRDLAKTFVFDSKAASQNRPTYANRLQLARNSKVEAGLATTAMQQLSGAAALPGSAVTPLSSPFQLANPTFRKEMRQMRQVGLADRGACELSAADAPAPLSTAALADRIEAKFGKFNKNDSTDVQLERAERIRQYLAQRVHYAVIVHEMGHSVGLRHNFVSSSDSYNYRPQYWQLRTKNGKVSQACTELKADGSGCVGPRYYDPVDDEENQNLIWMWMQSSTMDYAGEYTQDMLGLGAYDFAAARMFYGDAVATYKDASYARSGNRGKGVINKLDNFGGILGFQYEVGPSDLQGQLKQIHYSQLQNEFQLIKDCADLTDDQVQAYKPASWSDDKDGTWDPVVDGRIVKVNGKYSRCKTQPIEFSQWNGLKSVTTANVRSSRQYDAKSNNVRVPYGFATDTWADLGNLSVYRHDNGADPYELFTFLTAQPEVLHVFNDYRRGRMTFSVKSASERILSRYNEKMRDAAKGLGLLANIYRSFLPDYDKEWPGLVQSSFQANMLASGMAFDAYAMQMARPQTGDHFLDAKNNVYRSFDDYFQYPQDTVANPSMKIPDGANGSFSRMSFGGKLLNNTLAEDKGEYDSQYTMNVGSYYDKVWVPMLLTESVDNFISSSRGDFNDPRYRSVSIADLLPDGFRRFVANNLTNDEFVKGVRIEADASGKAALTNGFPKSGLGFTSWWRKTPASCFPGSGSQVCSDFADLTPGLNPNVPARVAVVDSQVGWEQQKFLIAMTLAYLPENQKLNWLDQMYMWELGADSDPGITNRIQFHAPNGRVYIARTYGTEQIFGKTVQKGISARVLEYANSLLVQAYKTTPVTQNGTTWYVPTMGADGQPQLNCPASNPTCTCTSLTACKELEGYVSMPEWMRQSLATFQFAPPSMKGVY
jgi:hypothetical protein